MEGSEGRKGRKEDQMNDLKQREEEGLKMIGKAGSDDDDDDDGGGDDDDMI